MSTGRKKGPECRLCGATGHAHGLCRLHYQRWLQTGDPWFDGTNYPEEAPTCALGEECSKPRWAHGLCKMHYFRWRKHGDPWFVDHGERKTPCAMGCGRHRICKGLCRMHYTRWQRWGDPFFDGKNYPLCTAGKCMNLKAAKGYCKMHYDRFRSHGDPLADPTSIAPIGVLLPLEPLLTLIADRSVNGESVFAQFGEAERSRLEVALRRAVKNGGIDAAVADDFVIRVFGIHPFFVWGEDWWAGEEMTDDEPQQIEMAVAA